MRYVKFLIPAVILTGCSMGSHDYQPHQKSASYGHQGAAYQVPYQQSAGCEYTGCASGYSVSNTQPTYGAQQAYAGHQYGAPQTPSAHAYGSQVAHHGPRGHQGYGQVPQLRRGYKYGTLGATMYDVEGDIFGVQGRFGYQSAGILGAELEASTGLSSETETVGADSAKLGIDYQAAAFAVARAPVSQKLSIHSRLGYHVTEFDAEETIGGVTTDVDLGNQDGIAYGFGGEYALSQRDSLRLDLTRYDVDGGALDSVALGYARKF